MRRSLELALALSLTANLLLPVVGWRAWTWRGELHERSAELDKLGRRLAEAQDRVVRQQSAALLRLGARPEAVLLGASITAALDPDREFPGRAWVVAAAPGEDSSRLRARFARDVLPLRPRVVFVAGDGGINRLIHRGATSAELDAFIEDTRALIAQAREAGVLLVLGEVLPTHGRADGRLDAAGRLVAQANERLAALASPPAVTVARLAAPLADAAGRLRPEYSTDGLHLDEAGQRLYARAIERTLAGVLGGSSTAAASPAAAMSPPTAGSPAPTGEVP